MQILLTTDRSEHSFRVFPHAAALAKAVAGAEITVLQVLDPRMDLGGELDTDLRRAAERVAQRWEGELGVLLAARGYSATPRVVAKGQRDDFAEAILHVGDEVGASLIAMDTRGNNRFRHALMGSVASDVVSRGRLPVMLTGGGIAEPPQSDRYHILVTNDGSEAALDVVRALEPLIRQLAPKITLLRLYEPVLGDKQPEVEVGTESAELEAVRASFPAPEQVEARAEMVEGLEKISDAIVRRSRELGANAIAMSTHGASARRHLLAGSVTMSVLGASTLPVIVARGSQ